MRLTNISILFCFHHQHHGKSPSESANQGLNLTDFSTAKIPTFLLTLIRKITMTLRQLLPPQVPEAVLALALLLETRTVTMAFEALDVVPLPPKGLLMRPSLQTHPMFLVFLV